MVMEFKKSKAAYFVVLFVACALVLLLLVPKVTLANGVKEYSSMLPSGLVIQSPLIRWVVIILGLFIAQMVASTAASSVGNKEFQKLASVLMNECNTTKFFERSAPLFKKSSRQAMLVKDLLLSKAYLAEGKYDRVFELCQKAIEESTVDWITQEMRLSVCGVYATMCMASVETGDSFAAVKTYSKLKATTDATVGNRAVFIAAETICLSTRDYIAIFAKEGYSDTAAIEKHIESAVNEYDRVLFHYALARLQERLGNEELSALSYNYVAKNGNTFACTAAAHNYLAQHQPPSKTDKKK